MSSNRRPVVVGDIKCYEECNTPLDFRAFSVSFSPFFFLQSLLSYFIPFNFVYQLSVANHRLQERVVGRVGAS